MTVELIVIGKTDSKEIAALVEMYARRVNFYCKFAVTALPDVRNTRNLTVKQQRTAEGEAILRQTTDGDYVVLLDERGEEMRSVEFAYWLQKRMNSGVKRLVLVIGGPYGFSDEVYRRADAKLSLSRMTFSHQIVRDLRRTDIPGLHHPQQRTLAPRMMQQRPVIAILTANVLVGVGLRSILEKAAPAADVELFGNFQEFAEADPERFIHYFVTAQLFAAHNAFFRARSHRTILLANGQTPAGVHCIDVQTDEERFVRSLMRLQHSVRRPEHALPVQPQAAQPLTEREAEVLTLIAGGLINKQVADRLGIGLTTVISHRRNIMEKLGIRTAAGLVVYALAAGYVDPDGM